MSDDLFHAESEPRRLQKSDAAFRTISEVSQELEVPQHVLRFWEGRFPQVKPLKRGGGRRYYRPEDVLLLKRIRDLLYKEGYTIRGVQKLLRDSVRGGAIVEPEMSVDEDSVDPIDLEDTRPPPIFDTRVLAALTEPVLEEPMEDFSMPVDAALPALVEASASLMSRDDLAALHGELERLRGVLASALRPGLKG